MIRSTGTEESRPSADDLAILGIAVAAVVSITAAEGPWELLELAIGAILALALYSLTDWRRLLGSPSTPRLVLVSSVAALCGTLVVSWPLQWLAARTLQWNVDDDVALRKFDDIWLSSAFTVLFVAVQVGAYVIRRGVTSSATVTDGQLPKRN